jgi:hypothetical protein
VHTWRDILQHKIIALCHLQELVQLLERQHDLRASWTEKSRPPVIHKNPYFRPLGGKAGH